MRPQVFLATGLVTTALLAACRTDPVGPAPEIALSPAGTITMTATAGGGNPLVQVVSISNGGDGLSVAISYAAGQPVGWLSATLGGTTAPTSLLLQAAGGALAPGVYSATVRVSAPDAGNSPQSIVVSFSIAAADLVISSPLLFVRPTSVLPGQSVALSAWRVLNRGNASSNSFSNGFYLSSDPVISAADVRLDGNSNSGLAPGESFDWGAPTLTIPAGTAPGRYYIGILVDEGNGTLEQDEGNNYKSVALDVGPLLRYQFESDVANSGALSGYNGTATSVTFPAGKFGRAIKFDGSATTGAMLAGTRSVFGAGSKWTISLWFRTDVAIPFSTLWTFRSGSSGWESYHAHANYGFAIYTCSNGGCFNFTPAPGVWHNLLYRYDGASASVGAPVQIYVDGVLAGQIDNPTQLPLVGAGVSDIRLGDGGAQFYVDEFRVYDRVFSVAQQCTLVIGGSWNGASCALP
jgi:hypothetical protein